MPSAVARLDCYEQLVDARAGTTSHVSKPGAVNETERSVVVPAATTVAAIPERNNSPVALFGKSEEQVRTSVQETTGDEKLDEIAAIISAVQISNTGR